MKTAYLVCVSENNNNKYYHMSENSDGTFTAKYGRVGSTEQIISYPMNKWDSTIKSKIKKGYLDQTHLHTVSNTVNEKKRTNDSWSPEVKYIVDTLLNYAKKNISETYTVGANQVTKKQVDEAQLMINDISGMINSNINYSVFNKKLLQLYAIIPRKMKNVKEHIINSDTDLSKASQIISLEQNTLDVMAGQVQTIEQHEDTAPTDILSEIGLGFVPVNADQKNEILKMLGNNANQYSKAYVVVHNKTQLRLNEYVQNTNDKTKMLLWHGSRNENWWNILNTGLLIRPSGVVITGAMFGNAVYFADKAQKSIGYSSLSGSYWAKGSAKNGYLAIYDVHVGNQKHIYKHDSSCYSLDKAKLQKDNYDSVFAHGGIDLRNNEFMIYDHQQCAIKYLVELK